MGRWTGLQALETRVYISPTFMDLSCSALAFRPQKKYCLYCRNQPTYGHIRRAIWAATSKGVLRKLLKRWCRALNDGNG